MTIQRSDFAQLVDSLTGEAEENEFPFPTSTNAQFQEALAALLQHSEEEEAVEQEVEEEVINEWNEDYNEQKDDANF